MRFRLSPDRIKASFGSIYAILYLGFEALGLILLLKLLTARIGAQEAGLVSLELYGVGLANVVVVALSVIATRTVAAASSTEDASGLSDLHALALKVFVGLAIASGGIVLALLVLHPKIEVGAAALAFAIGVIVRGWALLQRAKQVGRGYIGADKAYMMAFSGLFFFLSCLAVRYLHASLLAVAIVYLAIASFSACLSLRGVGGGEYNRHISIRSQLLRRTRIDAQFAAFLMMSLAGFLTMNGDVFLVSYFLGTSALAHYSIASKIGVGIFSLAVIYPSMRLQPIASLFAAGDVEGAAKLWRECILVAMAVGGFLVLVSVGVFAPLNQWIFAGSAQIQPPYFALICINSLIAAFIGANGWPIIASGKGNLIIPTWTDGVLVMLLGAIGANQFGLLGLLLGVTLAHLTSATMHYSLAKKVFTEH